MLWNLNSQQSDKIVNLYLNNYLKRSKHTFHIILIAVEFLLTLSLIMAVPLVKIRCPWIQLNKLFEYLLVIIFVNSVLHMKNRRLDALIIQCK